MSTRWTYQCDSHNPPERAHSDGWTYKAQLEEDLQRREQIASLPDFLWDEWQADLPPHWRWLRFHRTCAASLVSEYDEVALSVDAVRK